MEAVAELSRLAVDGQVHAITVDIRDTVVDVSGSLCDLIGVPRRDLVGHSSDVVRERAFAAFGDLRSFDVVASDDHRLDAEVAFDSLRLRVAMVALRGGDGRARRARILLAVDPQPA